MCCLTVHVFKWVQWNNVSNMNMMSRNIIVPLQPRLLKHFCRVLSWWQAHGYSQELPPPYLLTSIATLLIGSVSQSQLTKASYAQVQYSQSQLSRVRLKLDVVGLPLCFQPCYSDPNQLRQAEEVLVGLPTPSRQWHHSLEV